MIDLRPHIEQIARRLIGTPNGRLSNKTQLRFGTNGSVAVDIAGPKAGSWFDHEENIGGGPWELLTVKGGMANGHAVEWLRSQLDIDIDLAPKGGRQIVATYDYRDERGDLLFQVVRFDPKDFRQRRPNGNGGWEWSTKGTRMVLYHLPELLAAAKASNGVPPRVYIAEGEKDVDRLREQWGLTATCNPGGAGKWRANYNRYFAGFDVIILPDTDDAGRKHAQEVVENLAPVAASVRIVELANLPDKGDVSNWIDAGASQSDIETLVEATPLFAAPASNGHQGGRSHIIHPSAPYDTAKLFREVLFRTFEKPTLFHHRGAFYCWNGAAYIEIGDADLRSQVYSFVDQCITVDEKGKQHPFKPNKSRVANIIEGLEAAANLPSAVSAPDWLNTDMDLAPAEIIPCSNGLLYLPSLCLFPHNPSFFTYNALTFSYEAGAPAPIEWLRFLGQLWPEDPESIDTLQEIFGLCLTTETRHQKAFLLIGPKRSGKGTIARVLIALAGRCNAVSPTLASLGERFGLEPLIGKLLAVISDARLGAKADQHAIAESVLRITGEDDITADRKNRQAWSGQMRVRFLVISNELPRLADASGALASRFIILRLVNSFYGREDQTLTDRLLTELPGIFNWSLDGLHRLKARGHFIQPASAVEAMQELEDLSSPIGAFIRDKCEIGPACSAEVNCFFEAWCQWCKTQGRDHPGTIQTFGRDLRAAIPGLGTSQLGPTGNRMRVYNGIRLR